MELFATCPRGVEALLAEELGALGAENVEARRAACRFEGALPLAYRACLWSRAASRVLMPIARFPVADEQALYDGVRAIAWEEALGPRGTIAVDFAAVRAGDPPVEPAIRHSQFGAQRVKDAIVDRLREVRGTRPSVDLRAPDLRVSLFLEGATAQAAIDLSGESLHRRGWRGEARGAEAPLKESLAAAILLALEWPRRARDGEPLCDPMCGAGTLPIEAAWIARDRAPGLARERFGFHGWLGHDRAAWAALLAEAKERARAGEHAPCAIFASDRDEAAVKRARAAAASAGVGGAVRIERRELADLEPPGDRPGLLVVNPPYGERLGDEAELGPLYAQLGDLFKRRMTGWTCAVLTGNPELAKRIGLKPSRRMPLYNGAIECRLLTFPISAAKVMDERGPAWRRPRPEAEAFKNRLAKNARHLAKWAKREAVTCYRVYDADLPEYAVAVDRYEEEAQLAEYAPPKEIDPEKAAERLRDAVQIAPEVLGIDPAKLHVKVRRRQREAEGGQYRPLDQRGEQLLVREGGCRLLVNLRDRIDTGLYLDLRTLRRMLGEAARGRDFLNLFCYTATATVHAALGGARSSLSIDRSNSYLDWARQNLEANRIDPRRHRLLRAEAAAWLDEDRKDRFGLILLAPPTYSNSKSSEVDLEVQRDHAKLIARAAALLAPGGELWFVTHFRKFRLDRAALPGLRIEETTRRTIPPDFARDEKAHASFRVTRD